MAGFHEPNNQSSNWRSAPRRERAKEGRKPIRVWRVWVVREGERIVGVYDTLDAAVSAFEARVEDRDYRHVDRARSYRVAYRGSRADLYLEEHEVVSA